MTEDGNNPCNPKSGRRPAAIALPRQEGVADQEPGLGYGFIHDFATLEPVLHRMLALWSTKCIEGALPRTRDLGPDVLRGLVSQVAVVDVLEDPYDYRYRVVGSYVEDMIGEKRTGLRAREFMSGPILDFTIRAIEELVRFRQPVAMWGLKMPWIERDYKRWQAIVLPLSESGTRVDRAIMGFVFF